MLYQIYAYSIRFQVKTKYNSLNWKSLIKEFVQFVLVRCLSSTEGCDGFPDTD